MAVLRCYRGEKKSVWPPPPIRLIAGLTVFEPWIGDISRLWTQLQADIRRNGNGSVSSYAQYLRAEGRPYALATARTAVGSYETDYDYVIEIENARAFLWAGDTQLELGNEAPAFVANEANVTAEYIVLDSDTVADSTVLGFGHDTGTKEVTFFRGLPASAVKWCNKVPVTDAMIKQMAHLEFDEKMKYQKVLKPLERLPARPPRRSGQLTVPVPRLRGDESKDLQGNDLLREVFGKFRRDFYEGE
jgi:hypothetical protein